MKIKYLLIICFFVLFGCAVRPGAPEWTEKTIQTKYLSFQIWERDISQGDSLRIYIEGEGNPTPRKPVAWELAQRDLNHNVIYISRPCQYVWCDECKNPALWQEERFNEEIVDEMKSLVTYLAQKYQAKTIELVGYEGGATIALLIAGKWPVAQIITVGGILDPQGYAETEKITLNGMQPIELRGALAQIPQVHYVAQKDTLTPRATAEAFVNALRAPKSAVVKIVSGTTHSDWGDFVVE